jgi:SPP1 gp7 family putative phage head morphogenesis protein
MTVQAAARRFRRELLDGQRDAAIRLIRAYELVLERLNVDMTALAGRIASARAAGTDVSPAWLFQEERYQILIDQIEREIGRYATIAANETTALQGQAVRSGLDNATQLMLEGLGPAPLVARAAVLATFTRAATEPLMRLVGFLGDGTPLSVHLAQLGPAASEAVKDTLIVGLGTGQGPREIARMMRKATGMALDSALRLSRTAPLNAYREANLATYRANRDVVKGWTWIATMSPRTCPVCLSLHGQVFPLDEPMRSHWQCRCVASPLTASWSDLGFSGIPDRRPRIESGVDWFERQDDAVKLRILGPGKLAAYHDGTIGLDDLVGLRRDKVWGEQYAERSLRAIVGERRALQFMRMAAD